jgi:hypothetical protein
MRSILILFLLSHCVPILAQSIPDSLQKKAPAFNSKITSFSSKLNLDSLKKTEFQPSPDSLKIKFQKADSIRSRFVEESSQLKDDYDSVIGLIDKTKAKFTNQIDSLEELNLPTARYTTKLDSVGQLGEQTKMKFEQKSNALKAKTTDKLKTLDLPPQYQEPIQKLAQGVDGFTLQGDMPQISALKVPGHSLPELDGLETPIGDLGTAADQMKGMQSDVKSITEGNLNDVSALPQTLEEQALKLEGVSELQKQSGVIDEYKGNLENLNDPEAAKKEAAEMAKKAAMDKVSIYKQKYSSVSSIKDLPKRVPNAMKGKTFIERIVPGLYFQYQQKNYNLFDVNPYLGYRISGRLTSGVGWNQRFAYERSKHSWTSESRIFGPRVYVDIKLDKGFIAHLESEYMNTFVPSIINGNPENGKREWVWGLMGGLKKDYKIYKNLNGTVLLQYNLFNPKYKAPYIDRLNSRIGFEYVLKKKENTKKARLPILSN